MNVLGISGRHRDGGAALAVDGRIVAAATEDRFTRVPGIGYAQTGGFPTSAAGACLQAAGLQRGDVDELTVVDDDLAGLDEIRAGMPDGFSSIRAIEPVRADAVQAAISTDGVRAVLVCSPDSSSLVSFVRDGDEVRPERRLDGLADLTAAASDLAQTLGVADRDPYRVLDRLSIGSEPEFQRELACAIEWRKSGDLVVDRARLQEVIAAIGSRHAISLGAAASLNVHLQATRAALAASFTCQVARVIHDGAEALSTRSHAGEIAFGGAMVANPRLATELRRLVGDGLALAAVPEPAGRVLGAASGSRLPTLALGPEFADTDIKDTLDNCRLEYMYEPDWFRLLTRVSRMLSQGKIVAWFQGAMGFGPRPMGTRSVLADPSSQYARQNVNEYLRLVPLDEPLPLAFAPSGAAQCLTRALPPPLTAMDAEVHPAWRERLVSALDWRHFVRVHSVGPEHAPEFCALLESHYGRTGVPALIETNLAGHGEPIACTPRDAVRTVYASAIDALVIGRFLLMKDYWLLRTEVG